MTSTPVPTSAAAGGQPASRPPGWTPRRPTWADLARQVRDVAADLPRFATAPLLRPWHRRWGATRAEVTAPMRGDDVVPRAQLRATRAITIAAPPDEVWPWLVQVGCLRAGWYADDLLDNLAQPSARQILPELQDLDVGRWLPMAPHPTETTAFVVDSFQAPEWMLWRTPSSTWAWRLTPLPAGRTRLISRLRFAYDWRHPAGIVLMELGDWPMMRRMLRGVRERAEAEHRRRVPPAVHPRRLAAVKAVQTAAWASIEFCVGYLLWSRVRGRSDRRAADAAVVVAGECLIFAADGFRRPLTGVAERAGGPSGSVTDISLPRWLARSLPVIHLPPLVLIASLYRRALRPRRGQHEPGRDGRRGGGRPAATAAVLARASRAPMMTWLRGPEPTVSTAASTVEAGQPLEVTVSFVADRPLKIAGGQVELVRQGAVAHFERGWMGAGGTVSLRRSAVADRVDLDAAGRLAAGQQLVRRLTLHVPAGEATVDGYLVQQQYTVRARLHLAEGRDREAGAPVRVTSSATTRSWVLDTAAVVDDAKSATLGIEDLSTRRLHGGVPISGTVTVTPHRAGRAHGVRVELVLDEHVPARLGEMPLEEDRAKLSVVAAVPVTGPVDLQPGRVLRLPFSIRAPMQLPAPSISAPEFTLRWLLRAVLDRPLRPDPATTLELWGATAS